jgi:flagellar secretion chaperone FliS
MKSKHGGITMALKPYQAYQQNSVTTAPPAELTLMLYDGCLKFIRQGKVAILNGDVPARNTALQKAQKIIQEFIYTIDRKVPISNDFLRMYDFINRQLISANVSADLETLVVAEELVSEFRDTWKKVMEKTRQAKVKQASGQI